MGDEDKHLRRIIKQCEKISKYIQLTGVTRETFVRDEIAFDATVPLLIQIGESVNKLSKEFCENYPEIKWHQIRGLRNRITHDYEGVGELALWYTLTKNVPELKVQVEQILKKLESPF